MIAHAAQASMNVLCADTSTIHHPKKSGLVVSQAAIGIVLF
ncbi:hypothetical protein QJS24_gp45 [Serratia phage vB_SmaS_Rovert]|uniref:Uncharacterized protein n=1 Tax=Serratia phage vB_SmaS_Rovert TaxID=2777363 RepID=A0A7T3N9S4_9CAUD|nr:hypothetical protein QJS24_gp45 [Serratia phage vB_SmaS_Rovert]QPX75012.1 hypothetical protein [Serratia phage vB_SmaS_Rovert]